MEADVWVSIVAVGLAVLVALGVARRASQMRLALARQMDESLTQREASLEEVGRAVAKFQDAVERFEHSVGARSVEARAAVRSASHRPPPTAIVYARRSHLDEFWSCMEGYESWGEGKLSIWWSSPKATAHLAELDVEQLRMPFKREFELGSSAVRAFEGMWFEASTDVEANDMTRCEVHGVDRASASLRRTLA